MNVRVTWRNSSSSTLEHCTEYSHQLYLDERDLPRRTHVLCVGPHLDGEVQVAHVEESLDCEAAGVVWQEDLLDLVGLEELHVAGPRLLGAHLQGHGLGQQNFRRHPPRPCLKIMWTL